MREATVVIFKSFALANTTVRKVTTLILKIEEYLLAILSLVSDKDGRESP